MKKLLFVAAILGLIWYSWQNNSNNLIRTIQNQATATLDQLQTRFGFQVPDREDVNQTIQQINDNLDTLDLTVVKHVLSEQLGIHKLPNLPEFHNQNVPEHQIGNIQLIPGDSGVSKSNLQTADNLIQNISLPILKQNLWAPVETTHVVLFSTRNAYANGLEKAGIQSNMIPDIVAKTGGITIGSDVWIPLYASRSNEELADVLTHELTHVTLNEQGIGDQIPTWVNEGIAWHSGMEALNQLNPRMFQRTKNGLNRQLQQAVESGQLIPLSANEQEILQANYNVQWEDYLAVDNLIQKEGLAKFKTFLEGTNNKGVKQSFATEYGMSITNYEDMFYNSLLNS